MNPEILKNNVLRTLLYYDMFSFPLKPDELFKFMPQNSITKQDFIELVSRVSSEAEVPFAQSGGFYYVKPNEQYVSVRKENEEVSLKMWKAARRMTHIIKRFPFVRCIMVTGSLSKNNSVPSSDLDFMVIAKSHRMWIARTLLMLFKKIFLLNSYKYFCINYFITVDHLIIDDKNIFTATEIAHVKATFNTDTMNSFIKANDWIKNYFPNYILCDPELHLPKIKINNRKSYLQKVFELFFAGRLGNALDNFLRQKTLNHWNKRYKNIEAAERELMFRSTESVSKTHPGNMQKKILTRYTERLREFDL